MPDIWCVPVSMAGCFSGESVTFVMHLMVVMTENTLRTSTLSGELLVSSCSVL